MTDGNANRKGGDYGKNSRNDEHNKKVRPGYRI